MKPITRADLENAVTEAQYTVCVQHLREMKCPICGSPKEYYHSLCRRCWFALPEDYRKRLCVERDTPANIEIFVRAYLAAKDLLREMGMGELIA